VAVKIPENIPPMIKMDITKAGAAENALWRNLGKENFSELRYPLLIEKNGTRPSTRTPPTLRE
jgi:hypothetical protein